MDSLFNAEDNNSIQDRINKLGADTKPLWGKMNVSQMLAHLEPPCLRVLQNTNTIKRKFNRLFFW